MTACGRDASERRRPYSWPSPQCRIDVGLNGFGVRAAGTTSPDPRRRRTTCSKGLDLGGRGSAPRQAGQIIFEQFGGSPGSSYTWVELHDDLTVSLPRARLIEQPADQCRGRNTRLKGRLRLSSRNVRIACEWACSAASGDQFLLFAPRPDFTKANLWFLTASKPTEVEWRCRTKAGISKFLALKSRLDCARLFISGRLLGSARKGDFAHCSVVRGARKHAPLFPTRPRRPFPSFSHRRRGRAASPVIVAGLRRG